MKAMNANEKKVLLAVAAVLVATLVFPNPVVVPLAGFSLGIVATLWLIGLWR